MDSNSPNEQDADNNTEFLAILEEYKRVLKTKQITYKDIASKMGLSEAAIKKTLSSSDTSVSRMVDLCHAAGISYFELVRLADKSQERRIELTEAQETFFTDDLKSFKFFMLLLEQPVETIRAQHKLSDAAISAYLDKFQGVALIERGTGLKFKFLFRGKLLRWNPTGPFARQHNKRVSLALIQHVYDNINLPETFRKRASVKMSKEALNDLISRLQSVSDEFASRARREMATLGGAELVDASWVIGVAPFDVWKFLLGDIAL